MTVWVIIYTDSFADGEISDVEVVTTKPPNSIYDTDTRVVNIFERELEIAK